MGKQWVLTADQKLRGMGYCSCVSIKVLKRVVYKFAVIAVMHFRVWCSSRCVHVQWGHSPAEAGQGLRDLLHPDAPQQEV